LTSAEREVRDVVERIHELSKAKRYDEIGALLADDVVIAPPGAADRVRGRDAYVQSYRDFDAAAKTLAFERAEAEIDVVGDTAVAICRFAVTYELEGRTHDLLVFTRLPEGWRIAWRTMETEPANGPA